MKRLDRASAAFANALRILRAIDDPGYPSLGHIVGGLARIFGKLLGPKERLCVALAAFFALDLVNRQAFIDAVARGWRAAECPFPGVDREMHQQVWREHRSPPLTAVQKRRAAAISFDEVCADG